MGNTNLPQAGSAGQQNGRATRSGVDQLPEAKQKEAPKLPATRIKPPNPAVTPEEAIVGYIDTGHSPTGAT
ncbi:MAG: hypothetical protein ABI440_11560 [Casimicrobiaceae bacterium]